MENQTEPGELGQLEVAERDTPLAPEGGRLAWQTIGGSFLVLFSTFGLQSSVGLLQFHLSDTLLPQYTSFQVSWIPSTFVFLTLAASIQAGALFDKYGPRPLLLAGSVVYVGVFFLLAHCHAYWHFLLVLGVLGGLSSAVLITVGQSIVAHWFDRRRGLAGGVAMLGSALGGVIFPLILRYELSRSGWERACYLLGIVISICLTGGIFLVRRRLVGSRTSFFISFSCFHDVRFLWTTLAIFGYELFTIAGWGLIPTVIIKSGFGTEHSFYNVIAMALGSLIGRILPPWFADAWGRYNVLTGITIITTLYTPLITTAVNDLAIMYMLSVLIGMSSGAFVCLSATCLGQICEPDVYGQWMGASYSVVSLATLVSIPIGIALESNAGINVRRGALNIYGYLTGILVMSLVACLVARWACLGWCQSKFFPRRSDIV